MDNAIGSASRIGRAKSDQLPESMVAAAMKSSESMGVVAEDGGGGSGSASLSRKSSRRMSPKNTHIRKARSAQLKVEVDEVSSGVALSRASSASLGLSFSFTGFTLPPDEISDTKPFSDDDIPEDIEAGIHKPKFHTEPTLPIYLKGTAKIFI